MKGVPLCFFLFISIVFSTAWAETGVKKRRPLPFEYGRVIINNYSEKAHLPAVSFDHWLHRANFTCKVCHVDIGFAMRAEQSRIRAIDNMEGYYCGTCHNGDRAFSSCENVFARQQPETCVRCHSVGVKVERKYDFKVFTKDFPKERLGNGIDWERAEASGKIKPINFLEGISIKREGLEVQKDFGLEPKVEAMPGIIFSHAKHTVWNSCELCHPEIFVGIKRGKTKYSMSEIYEGKFCGVCHGKVAFPLLDCQRCHSESVQ